MSNSIVTVESNKKTFIETGVDNYIERVLESVNKSGGGFKSFRLLVWLGDGDSMFSVYGLTGDMEQSGNNGKVLGRTTFKNFKYAKLITFIHSLVEGLSEHGVGITQFFILGDEDGQRELIKKSFPNQNIFGLFD